MRQLETLERILRERLFAEDGAAIVRHVLGNPVQVEYVSEVRRRLEGRVVGVKIRPRGGMAPTTMELEDDSGLVTFEREGRELRHARVEPRDVISLMVATEGYGKYLPGVYTRGVQNEARGSGRPQADFLRRFLLIFQTLNFEVERRVGGRSAIVDPVQMDPRFLPWLASWLDFVLDERIPVTRRRIFLRRAVELFQWRGTTNGLTEMIKTLTGLDCVIAHRRGPQPMELGNCALVRPDESDETRNLPYVTHAGEHLLVSPRFAREEYFTIVLDYREELVARYRDRLSGLLEQVARVAQHERPAHLNFVICFKDDEVSHNGLVLSAPEALSPLSALGRAVLTH